MNLGSPPNPRLSPVRVRRARQPDPDCTAVAAARSDRVGAYVQITGTAGAGLRFREKPGLEAPVLLLGAEAEVFRVEEGPQEIDGYVWWYLVGPYNPARRGWAVANYLEIVQNP